MADPRVGTPGCWRAARRRLARRYPTYAAFQALKPGGQLFKQRPLTLLAPDADGNADARTAERGVRCGLSEGRAESALGGEADRPRICGRARSAAEGCRATIPLLKTRWLAKKGAKRVLLTMTPAAEHTGVVFGIEADVPARRRQPRAAARARPADGRRPR